MILLGAESGVDDSSGESPLCNSAEITSALPGEGEKMNWRNRYVSGHVLALLVLVGLSLSASSVFAADCIVPSAGNVTLRAAPSSSSAARGALKPGETSPFIASMPSWYETRNANGQTAFAAKRSTNIAPCPTVPGGPSSTDVAFELHAIDVGTGLSVLVRGADFALLYDAGSNDDMARGTDNRTLAYIKTLQPPLQKLDHVVLSHPHRDHVELLPDVVAELKPGEVWNSGAYNDICGYRNFLLAIAADPSVKYHTATQDLGDEQIVMGPKNCYGDSQPQQTVTLSHAGRITNDKVALGQSASMTFLYADGSNHSGRYNENSLVVRLDLGSRRVLLMGDAEAGGRQPPTSEPTSSSIEGKLLTCCAPELKADVIVVGHHGSKTSSRKKSLNAVAASIFIVSAGPTKYATVVLPDAEIVAELETRGQVFRTDLEDDACLASSDKVGPDDDGKPGGCDNVFVTISANGVVTAEYRRVAD